MLTDIQLQKIKKSITDIEIDNYDVYFGEFGLTKEYVNKEYHHKFNDCHLVLSIELSEYYSNLFCYNGSTESDLTNSENEIEILNIAINDIEYKFTEEQQEEIINSINNITFKS